MDEQEEVQQNNMISNLPLLFANGYPTSLDKISESQLESFIPFMVQCSLGHINLQGKIDCSEPEWWPEDLSFNIPFTKPKKFIGDWMLKMKEVVVICYQFHKSVFLLRFCNDLASYEHASLRFINNYNSTTSLFDRRSNKLLVTFRNENMSYDQPQRTRKCLLQQKSRSGNQTGQEQQHMMVEPAPFDIYLCDNCDAELYSKDAILEHEKTCNVDDDDVILCDTPEPCDDNQRLDLDGNNEIDEQRAAFLLNFNLKFREKSNRSETTAYNAPAASVAKEDCGFMILDRNKRLPRRNRAVHSLTRCPTIPLSSPAGQLLLRSTKTEVMPEYLAERLDRMERFCHAPPLSKTLGKPKCYEKKQTQNSPHCTFKKQQEYSAHMYVFPRRQFSQRRRAENFLFLNSPLIKRCRPISVRLKKINKEETKLKRSKISSTKLNIKLTRDAKRSSNWKITSPSAEIIVDTIDLCSSDDDYDDCTNVQEQQQQLQHQQQTVLQPHNLDNKIFPKPGGVTVMPTKKKMLPRTRLKQISNCINTSEISLIPIHKDLKTSYANNHEKVSMSSSLLKLVTTSATEPSEENNTTHGFEGNIVLSPSSGVGGAENGIVIQKALRPSVYIFSKYTNSLAAIVATSDDLSSTGDDTAFINYSQNQENHEHSSNNIVTTKRSTSSTAATAAADWFAGVNSLTSDSNNSIQSHAAVERERTTESIALVQSFSSPSRIVSIDLTS